MKIYLSVILLSSVLLFSCNNDKNNSPVELKTELDTMSYYYGLLSGNSIKSQGPDSLDISLFSNGMKEGYSSEIEKEELEKMGAYIQDFFQKSQMKSSEKDIEAGRKFLEENKKREGVITLPSGLQYEIIKEGSGVSPIISDVVKCHYKGTLIDGTVFDSSYDRGEPSEFPVNRVIPGWTEALQLMKVGAKWKLYIPYEIAYGDRAAGSIKPYSTLIFDIELIEIIDKK